MTKQLRKGHRYLIPLLKRHLSIAKLFINVIIHAHGINRLLLACCSCELIQALAINRKDTWATHTMSHVYLETSQIDNGREFVESTLSDWEVTRYVLAAHER